MAKLSIVAGATSQSINVFIQNSSSTTGAGLTGLVFNTSSLTAYYTFAGTNAGSVQIVLATLAAVNSAYSSGGFKEIDATNMPGWYRLDLPNTALATSKGRCVSVHLQGATNMAPCPIEIELTGWDNQDGVHGGMTSLPNAAAGANTGLPVVGTQVPNATAGASGGLLISGSNAGTTTLAALTCTGTFTITDGLVVSRSTSNSDAISATGSGSGSGMHLIGGAAVTTTAAGHGLLVAGGAASTGAGGVAGNAFNLTGGAGAASTNGASSGMVVAGGGTNTVGSSAHAVSFTGTSGGNGLNVQGGSNNNTDAMKCLANGSGGAGLDLIGNVSGAGLTASGGTTGAGMFLTAGGTSGIGLSIQTSNGDGISVNPTSGNAFTLTANGSGKHGLNITAGTGGHGITATGGAAVTTTAAGHGIIATGGASSTGVGGTAGNGFNLAGGAGSASQNGAADGLKSSAGGTTTVSGAAGFNLLGSGAIAGFLTTGGGTGPGARFVGGSTSGNSIDQAVTSGNAWINANATAINAVSTSSVTTINANQGTTQPVNFTGTAAAALVKTDVTDIATVAVNTGTAQLGVNVVNAGGTAWASGSLTSGVFSAGAINRAALSADSGLQPIRSNTAQAGAAGTITLDASASATDNFYNNCLIYLTGGTGVGQSRFITGYVGATKVATVSSNWKTNPDATTTFAIEPFDAITGAPTAAQVATAVWQDLTSSGDFTVAGSIGKLLAADTDPWNTALPGSYAAGTAGYILGNGVSLTVTERQTFADTILGRSVSNIQGSAAPHSLCTLILMALESSASGTTLTITQTNGSTPYLTKTLATNPSAVPITGIS